jgi:hypothetical protein
VINGNAIQAQIARAFGLPLLRVKCYVKLYCEGGTAAFLIVQALESPAARQAKDPLPHSEACFWLVGFRSTLLSNQWKSTSSASQIWNIKAISIFSFL